MLQQDDQIEIEDAGASSDLPDEASYPDFLEKTQAQLARQGWEFRGTCGMKSYVDALYDGDIDEVLFVPIPGQKGLFYYFNRLEGWEVVDSLRNQPGENFLELVREELAGEQWEYQDTYDKDSLLDIFDIATHPFLIIRDVEDRDTFYAFYSVENV